MFFNGVIMFYKHARKAGSPASKNVQSKYDKKQQDFHF